ncbi:hypothetical protein [Martelella endophytica]|uniref:Uncharacterized protein n=1 Tax=Martelella endophytica TaxID=1486262 RepID=A0A0D5LRH9_MAREN|nr:hypothetical protein [Martelella endophytica]AJY46540.1 hypothetical protein TM49_14035 [Martelella endophytica]
MTLLGDWFYTVGTFVANNALVIAQVIAAFVTAGATIALWNVTRVLAVETSNLAKMTAQPFVVCWLESSGADATALDLTFRNTGNAVAFDVELKLSPALPSPDGRKQESKEQTYKLSMLPPGHHLAHKPVLSRDVRETIFLAEISWAKRPRGTTRETLSYDFQAKDGFRGGWNTKGSHQIAEELKKIREKLPRS